MSPLFSTVFVISGVGVASAAPVGVTSVETSDVGVGSASPVGVASGAASAVTSGVAVASAAGVSVAAGFFVFLPQAADTSIIIAMRAIHTARAPAFFLPETARLRFLKFLMFCTFLFCSVLDIARVTVCARTRAAKWILSFFAENGKQILAGTLAGTRLFKTSTKIPHSFHTRSYLT